MRNSQRSKSGKSGQGMVELILTLFAFFTILFMFVQIALSFGVANYIQYATFMASRAFLAGHQDLRTQKGAAQGVVERMLKNGGRDRFAGIIKASGEGDPTGTFIGPTGRVKLAVDGARQTAWEQGVTYKFKMKFYMLPILRAASNKPPDLELESQSYLGREPTEDECIRYLEQVGPGLKQVRGIFLYDNGC